MREAEATLRERYSVELVALFGNCYGGGRALEAVEGWILSPPSRAVVVGSNVDNKDVIEVDE